MRENKKSLDIYISVDIESNGPIPGSFSMTSFGAAVAGTQDSDGVITPFEPELNEDYTFYRQLKPISDEYSEEAYMVGLVDGLPETATAVERHDFLKKYGTEPIEAMTEFNQWLNNIRKTVGDAGYNSRVIFSAYPLGFDWLFIYWYLIQFTGESAFGFSGCYDIKTAYKTKANVTIGQAVKRQMPKSLLSTRRHTHHALDDAIEQGELLMNILTWDGKLSNRR